MKIRSRIYTLIAGLGFLLYVIWSMKLTFDLSDGGIVLNQQQMSWMGIGLAFAIMYFIGKRHVGLLIVSAMAFLQDITDFTTDLKEVRLFGAEAAGNCVADILEALSFAALFALFLVSIMSKVQKKVLWATVLTAAVCVFDLAGSLVYWIGEISSAPYAPIRNLIPYMAVSGFVSISFIFAGLWIIVEMKRAEYATAGVGSRLVENGCGPYAPAFGPVYTAQPSPASPVAPESTADSPVNSPEQVTPEAVADTQTNSASVATETNAIPATQEPTADSPAAPQTEAMPATQEPTAGAVPTSPKTNTAPVAPQPIIDMDEELVRAQKSAKSLQIYKELLDHGLITQDDYNLKKQQILGL